MCSVLFATITLKHKWILKRRETFVLERRWLRRLPRFMPFDRDCAAANVESKLLCIRTQCVALHLHSTAFTTTCCPLPPPPPPAVSTHTEGEDKIQVLLMVEGRRYVSLSKRRGNKRGVLNWERDTQRDFVPASLIAVCLCVFDQTPWEAGGCL